MKVEIEINPSLHKSILEYCKMNLIKDVDSFIVRCMTNGFNILRFGISPTDNMKREKEGIKDFKPEKKTRKKPEEKKEEESSKEEEKPIKTRKIRIIKKD